MTEKINIPNDRQLKKLGEVCTYSKGKKPAFLSDLKTMECSIPYINIKAFEKGVFDEYTNGERCNLCNDDNLLMVWDGARCGLVGKAKTGAVGSTLMKIEPKSNLDREYLYYFLLSKYRTINSKPKGVGIPHVEPNLLWNFEIPIPPLPEQHRIVSRIEELFSELDNGIAQLKTAKQQLKVYRQSLLKAAFEGRLTAAWRQANLKERKEELSMAAEPEAGYGKDGKLPEGWKWVNSGKLFSFVTSGSRGWAKYYSNSGAIFIRITNLNYNTLKLDLSEDKIQYVNPPLGSEGSRTKIIEGDFLFSITGDLGMFAIAQNLENAYVNQHVCLCRPKDGFCKEYVGFWIISNSGGHFYLNKSKKGAVKAGLNLDDLKNFPVPLAPEPEQEIIRFELETRLTVCDKLGETINQNLQQAEALRQSILKRAFEGRLV